MRPLNQPIRQQDWAGLRVWLIGASAGIGAALAQKLSGLGARLVLSARQAPPLHIVAQQCASAKPLVLPLDVCDGAAIALAVSMIRKDLGGLDLVIFNAGTYDATRIDSLTASGAEQALRVNLLAPIAVTSHVLPLLLASTNDDRPRGLAYVASVAGYRGLPRALTYGPGKAGLISFAESLWVDLQGLGLNTWIINPGFVRTRLTAGNDFTMPALIEPEAAARAMINGFSRGRFEIHFPRRFTCLMKLLRLLPVEWYLRLSKRLVPVMDRNTLMQKTTGTPDQHPD